MNKDLKKQSGRNRGSKIKLKNCRFNKMNRKLFSDVNDTKGKRDNFYIITQ